MCQKERYLVAGTSQERVHNNDEAQNFSDFPWMLRHWWDKKSSSLDPKSAAIISQLSQIVWPKSKEEVRKSMLGQENFTILLLVR